MVVEGYNALCTGTHAFIPANKVVNVQLIIDAAGQKVQNVYNVLAPNAVVEADLDRIKNKFVDWATNNWKPNSSAGCSLALMVLRDQTVENGLAKEYPISPAIVGTAGGGNLPLSVTAAIKWSSGLAGRSYRGRTYHIGLVPGHANGNQLQTGHAVTLQAMYAALITKLNAGLVVDKLVVVSRCNGGVWRTNAITTPIASASVDINLDSQRRRLTGRGN